ncbi:MAG: hypothetical protein H6738_24815 [Alphaproteobacteria bacterium]|nr:hypothetical protein [Alphaproteobacteria bacterium]MCB9700033.1 hypothetical protein [Alphaproteobacteria bacterium]
MEADRRGEGREPGRDLRPALIAGLLAALSRWALLLRDQTATGYDAWYYVLQVRSILAGQRLFDDDSLVFWFLAAMGRATGDVLLGDELSATLFAAAAAALGTACAQRLGGLPGAALGGAVLVAATGHLSLSAEFLKNAAGLVALCGTALALADRRWGWAVAAALLAVGLHKLSGVLALALLLTVGVVELARRSRRAALLAGLAGTGVAVLVALAGALRVVDLQRLVGVAQGSGRWHRLVHSSLEGPELVELALVHASPLLVPLAIARGADRALVLGLGLLAVVCAAPGLPFSFDATAWRLLCMGFLPLALLLAACRPPSWLAAPLAVLALVATPGNVAAHARRSPDYAAWTEVLPLIRAEVPEGGRLVAHRGLCGFLWAEGGIRCENFEPDGDPAEVWRVAFGFSPQRLAPYGGAVQLLPSYVLVPEPVWRDFRAAEGDRWSLLRDPRNPHEPRPAFVYRSGE